MCTKRMFGGGGYATPGIVGFGGGRQIILSALFWITLIVTILNWLILTVFFWVSVGQRTVTISWYASPWWWAHIYASGAFTAATIDSVQAVPFIFKPSVASTVLMGIATILDVVGGYYYIIDYWGQCIFNKSGLTSLQKIGCNDEYMYVWIVWAGAIVAIATAFVAFVLSLWDSAVRLVRSRQFGMVSGGVQSAQALGRKGISRVLGQAQRVVRPRSMEEQPLSLSPEGELESESMYHQGGANRPRSGRHRGPAAPPLHYAYPRGNAGHQRYAPRNPQPRSPM